MVKPFFLLSSVCYVYIYVMRYVYYVNLVVLVGLGCLTAFIEMSSISLHSRVMESEPFKLFVITFVF